MEIVSVHVPKTAGTTFSNVLIRNYGLDQVFKDYANEDLRSVRPEHRVIHGHFCVAKYHGLYPEAKRIAWIRHPAAWLISFYFYARTIPRQPGNPAVCRLQDDNLSILEFAEHPTARNVVTRQYLYGLELEEFDFVGVQEHFRTDLDDLSDALGWSRFEVGNDNANPDPTYREELQRYTSDRKLVGRLEALNELDMLFYEQSLRLRDRRRRGAHAKRASRPWNPMGWGRMRRAS